MFPIINKKYTSAALKEANTIIAKCKRKTEKHNRKNLLIVMFFGILIIATILSIRYL